MEAAGVGVDVAIELLRHGEASGGHDRDIAVDVHDHLVDPDGRQRNAP